MRALLIAGIALLAVPAPARAALAYRDAAGDVVVAHDDGSHPRVLARGREPSLSPDGRRLAFLTRSHCGCNAGRLHVIDTRGQHARVLAQSVYSPGFRPLPLPWSPDSTRIAAAAYSQFGGYVFDLRRRRRHFVPSDFRLDGATFSPDSTRMIYEDSGGTCREGRMVLLELASWRRTSLGCGEGAVWGRRGFAFLRGRGLYFVTRPGQKKQLLMADDSGGLVPIGWSNDGYRLLVIRPDPSTSALHALILDRRTGMTQTLSTSFTAISAISRNGRDVLGETDGNVVAGADDGTTKVLARNAGSPTWNR
jgi:Tol biopolymer transport system component